MSQINIPTVSPDFVHKEVQRDPSLDFIDVRTPVEFNQIHAAAARNVPLDSLDPKAVLAGRTGQADGPLYVICHSGGRAAKACVKFSAAGFSNALSVEGGTQAWEQSGLPVVRGKKVMSLERQVRIAAGSLVFIGSLLAVTVNIYFLIIPAFVGCGLVFAGLTDTCGMGMMLAKMPWNKKVESRKCQV